MNSNNIYFNEDFTLIGMFEIPNVGNFAGKLLYKVNEMLEFHIYTNSFNMPKNIEIITARLVSEDEKTFFATFNKCRLEQINFSAAGNGFVGYFDNVLFSKSRFFDNSRDDFKTAHIHINNWAEFCFPQGFKSRAKYEPIMKEFRLKNRMQVSFNQDVRGKYLSKNIFNDLFVNWNLTKNKIERLETQLENILLPHRDSIGIKNFNKHQWYIKLSNIPKKYGIDIAGYYINSLMKCLTYNFGTEINRIEVISNDILENSKIPINFDYLCYKSVIFGKKAYKFNQDSFNINTFSDNEWETILNNLFTAGKILEPFFDILFQNHKEATISEYHLERYIDCIQSIGNNKNYKKIKYELVLKDFVNNLDSDLKKNLLSEFRNALKVINTKNVLKKRNWGLIGEKISQLRAKTTHFNESTTRIDVGRYLKIYFVLELITIDYIFELLGISIENRLKYKTNYLKYYLKNPII